MKAVRLTSAAATRRAHSALRSDPFAVPSFLRPRFLRRRARLIGSPCWECARCHGQQGERVNRSPRFCEFGCDDAELMRFATGVGVKTRAPSASSIN